MKFERNPIVSKRCLIVKIINSFDPKEFLTIFKVFLKLGHHYLNSLSETFFYYYLNRFDDVIYKMLSALNIHLSDKFYENKFFVFRTF